MLVTPAHLVIPLVYNHFYGPCSAKNTVHHSYNRERNHSKFLQQSFSYQNVI